LLWYELYLTFSLLDPSIKDQGWDRALKVALGHLTENVIPDSADRSLELDRYPGGSDSWVSPQKWQEDLYPLLLSRFEEHHP